MIGKSVRLTLLPLMLAAGLAACDSGGVQPGIVNTSAAAPAASNGSTVMPGGQGRVVSIREVGIKGQGGGSGNGALMGGMLGAAGGGLLGGIYQQLGRRRSGRRPTRCRRRRHRRQYRRRPARQRSRHRGGGPARRRSEDHGGSDATTATCSSATGSRSCRTDRAWPRSFAMVRGTPTDPKRSIRLRLCSRGISRCSASGF